MIQEKEIYWLAGLLDGEGCFYCAPAHKGYRPSNPRICLSMTDRDIVERSHRLLGATGKISPRKKYVAHYTQQWVFEVTGARAIGWMFTLYPLLSERRREKIREVVNIWRHSKVGRPKKIAA